MSSVRLTLNTSRPIITNLLEGVPTQEGELLMRTIRWDVARQLVTAALGLEGITELEFDPDAITVAGTLRNVLAAIWPRDELSTLRQRWKDSPELMEIQIQHHARLLAT